MSGWRSARWLAARITLAGAVVLAVSGAAAAQDTVSIGVPSFVGFLVTDVTRSTSGSPGPTTVSFSSASLGPGKALRVSVHADTATFAPPSGPGIPASKVSWSSAGASGGIGMSGTLSSSSDALVFQSDPARTSGHVDLEWTLAAPGAGIRAGNHQLSIRWKVESITP